MSKQVCIMDYREEARLLGGSAADWMVLVGGVLLAGLFAAVFVLYASRAQLKGKYCQRCQRYPCAHDE